MTAHAYLNPSINKKDSQWSKLDQILNHIRKQQRSWPNYGRHYFQAIVQLDQKFFNGERTWADIKDITQLPLPTYAQVLEAMGETASSEDADYIEDDGDDM